MDKDIGGFSKKGTEGGLMDKIDKERLRFITYCSVPQSLRGGVMSHACPNMHGQRDNTGYNAIQSLISITTTLNSVTIRFSYQ